MKNFVVEYTLPYEHRVQVGIRAQDPETAVAEAERLFDEGSIWDDTPDVPLLFDDYEEDGDAGVPLQFSVVAEVTEWPIADGSVQQIRRKDAAFNAARLLVDVYQQGLGLRDKSGGHVDWEKLDLAYHQALKSIHGE